MMSPHNILRPLFTHSLQDAASLLWRCTCGEGGRNCRCLPSTPTGEQRRAAWRDVYTTLMRAGKIQHHAGTRMLS